MFLLGHVLSQQVTDISYVVIWKSTAKCFIKSCTRKPRNWYFKRCGLKNYRKKVQENVLLRDVIEKQVTDIWNVVVWKRSGAKYGKMFL